MARVTVAICTYNRSKYLQESLQSALGQTYKDIDIVVYDNGSTDDTEEVVKKYLNKGVKYIKFPINDRSAFNIILSECKTEFLVIFHDDDIMLPHMIETEVRAMDKNPDAIITSCEWNWDIDANGITIRKIPRFLLKTKKYKREEWINHICALKIGSIACPPTMFRMDSVDKYQLRFSKECGPCADELMWLNLNRFGSIVTVGKYLFKYRRHITSDSVSIKNSGSWVATHRYLLNWLSHNFPNKDISKYSDALVFSSNAHYIEELAQIILLHNQSSSAVFTAIKKKQALTEQEYGIKLTNNYWTSYVLLNHIAKISSKYNLSLNKYLKARRLLKDATGTSIPLKLDLHLIAKYILRRLRAFD